LIGTLCEEDPPERAIPRWTCMENQAIADGIRA